MILSCTDDTWFYVFITMPSNQVVGVVRFFDCTFGIKYWQLLLIICRHSLIKAVSIVADVNSVLTMFVLLL